jgi:hypothetical protein
MTYEVKMNATDISYPALYFAQGLATVAVDKDGLTICNTAGLKRGCYDRMLVVDSNGIGRRVKGARKLHGVGPFWGYNIFLNRRIRVELVFDGEPFPMSVDDVRRLVLDSFRKWHGWRTRGDFKELKASVQNAQSVAEIIRLVSERVWWASGRPA